MIDHQEFNHFTDIPFSIYSRWLLSWFKHDKEHTIQRYDQFTLNNNISTPCWAIYFHQDQNFRSSSLSNFFSQFSVKRSTYIPWLALSFIPCIRSSDHAWFNHLLGTDIFGRPTSFYSNSAEQLLSTTLGIAVQHLHHHRVRFLSSLSRLKAVVGEGYWLPLDNAYSSPSEIGDLFIEVAASLSRAGEGVSIGCPILLDLSIGYWWILIHFSDSTGGSKTFRCAKIFAPICR